MTENNTAKKDVKAPHIRIPVQIEATGSNAMGVMYTQGKITPMFRMLYANAEYGDITRTSPEARRVKTWTCAVAVPPRLANTSTSPILPSPATGSHVNRWSSHEVFARHYSGWASLFVESHFCWNRLLESHGLPPHKLGREPYPYAGDGPLEGRMLSSVQSWLIQPRS